MYNMSKFEFTEHVSLPMLESTLTPMSFTCVDFTLDHDDAVALRIILYFDHKNTSVVFSVVT